MDIKLVRVCMAHGDDLIYRVELDGNANFYTATTCVAAAIRNGDLDSYRIHHNDDTIYIPDLLADLADGLWHDPAEEAGIIRVSLVDLDVDLDVTDDTVDFGEE